METMTQSDLRDRVEKALSDHVKRFLDSHAGDVEVGTISPDGDVELHFRGACTSCPALPATFHTAVEPVLRRVPGVRSVHTKNVNISKFALERLIQISSKRPINTTGPTGGAK